mgnify:CR=1 FL=1
MTIDSVKKMKDALCEKLKVSFGSTVEEASDAQMMRASALVLRDVMAERSVDTMRETREEHRRQVHYLSMEFLMGRSLMKNAFNLGVGEILTEALDELGIGRDRKLDQRVQIPKQGHRQKDADAERP